MAFRGGMHEDRPGRWHAAGREPCIASVAIANFHNRGGQATGECPTQNSDVVGASVSWQGCREPWQHVVLQVALQRRTQNRMAEAILMVGSSPMPANGAG